MCEIMREAVVPKLALTLWGVETLVGREIDLWPVSGGSGSGGDYTNEEFDHEAAVRAEIKQRKERFEQIGALNDAPPSDVVKFL